MSAPAFHKIDGDAVEAMAPGDVWTWTTNRGFVAVFHPDNADGTDKLTTRAVRVPANDTRQVAVAYSQDAKARCLNAR